MQAAAQKGRRRRTTVFGVAMIGFVSEQRYSREGADEPEGILQNVRESPAEKEMEAQNLRLHRESLPQLRS
jgi:hypothetical protein